MMNSFKNIKDKMKSVKDLQKLMGDIDMSDPNKMMESMGIDMNELNKTFMESHNKKIQLNYTNNSEVKNPEYAYPTDSGFDLRSTINTKIMPFGRLLIPTGLFLDIPEGYEIQVRPKSGLAIKSGLSVLNTPGTVDQGYTGEIQVIMINLSSDFQTIHIGDKIAQAVLCPVVSGKYVNLVQKENIEDKDRGDKGFGSTGN